MTQGLTEEYTTREFDTSFRNIVKALSTNPELCPLKERRAYLLGGQSGAGKTTLHKVLSKEFGDNSIVINGDEYRSYHPRFRELHAAYGVDAVSHTAPWAGEMTEALINVFSMAGYNLIVEGTLRTSQVPLETAELLKSRGYGVSLALMAVKPEISLISCQIRYEQMRRAGTTPRATDPKHHNRIVHDIVENLSVLEDSSLFDEVRLYSRSKTLLFPMEGRSGRASDALQNVLFGDWTREERKHYEFLESRLKALHTQGRR